MSDIAALIQHGTSYSWLFLPSAVLLGALHGLEPGHSKTMMAAFIIAIRGTVAQAAMLALAATLSHTAVVWVVALIGLHLGSTWNLETHEPYFQLATAAIMIGVAVWMLGRTWHHRRSHAHGHPDAHDIAHANDIRHRFAGKEVTNGQIILFGLTGGLIPCPASVAILLLCLQLKKLALGVLLVLGFSIGLALTLVSFGVLAALSVKHISRHWTGLDALAGKAPYVSGSLIMLIGLYVGYCGLAALG